MRTADQPIRITLVAPDGRMGKAIAKAAAENPGFEIDQDHGDVLVDFSSPAALQESLDRALSANVPILVGTTGLQPEHRAAIEQAARKIAVIQAPNTSLGINLLRDLVEQAAARLGADWDIEILEMHHRHKVDAPSGTALLLGEAAARGLGRDIRTDAVMGRSGVTGERQRGAIGFASLRGGDVVGDHCVVFAGPGERLELAHKAGSRLNFAQGALRAAKFVAEKRAGGKPALFDMRDVLGLR